MRGLRLFNDPEKANCAGCHTAEPTKEGYPPHFTDFSMKPWACRATLRSPIPRTRTISTSGFVGRSARIVADQTQFCGMFKTPTLRNTAVRRAFFHNGVFNCPR